MSPSSAPSVCSLLSLCSSVICSKGLRVGYSEGCYGVWPQFSTQLLIHSHPALHWVTDCMHVRVCVCVSSYYTVWPPPICLAVGVRGHADPSGECQFPGYPEWPYTRKALQRDRGKHCAVTGTQTCACRKMKAKTNDLSSLLWFCEGKLYEYITGNQPRLRCLCYNTRT